MVKIKNEPLNEMTSQYICALKWHFIITTLKDSNYYNMLTNHLLIEFIYLIVLIIMPKFQVKSIDWITCSINCWNQPYFQFNRLHSLYTSLSSSLILTNSCNPPVGLVRTVPWFICTKLRLMSLVPKTLQSPKEFHFILILNFIAIFHQTQRLILWRQLTIR